jgi:hypothetical protein
MSLASALNVLRPTLPFYMALTKYDLLHINCDSFELRHHPAAPALALEMVKTVFTMGASSCVESYVMSRMLTEGPKVFAFDSTGAEASGHPVGAGERAFVLGDAGRHDDDV